MVRTDDPAVDSVVKAIVESRKMLPKQSTIVQAIGKARGIQAVNQAVEADIVSRWELGKSILLTLTPLGCQRYSLKADNDKRFILQGEKESKARQFGERGGMQRETSGDDSGPAFRLDRLADPRMATAIDAAIRFDAAATRLRTLRPDLAEYLPACG